MEAHLCIDRHQGWGCWKDLCQCPLLESEESDKLAVVEDKRKDHIRPRESENQSF